MSEGFYISGFQKILVNKYDKDDFYIVTPFNHTGQNYIPTFISTLAPASQKLIDFHFGSVIPKPTFKENIDAIIINGNKTVVEAGKHYVAFKVASKQATAIDMAYAAKHFEEVDLEDFRLMIDNITYKFVVDAEGCIGAKMWIQPHRKESFWGDSYIPMHNVFTDKNAVVVNKGSIKTSPIQYKRYLKTPEAVIEAIHSGFKLGKDIKVNCSEYGPLMDAEYPGIKIGEIALFKKQGFGNLQFILEINQ
ncbi:hypothetical protein SHAb15599_00079 [Acinetobacter phage SH-Ab 15599]|nr:hypothetical protein SHAb15599_00079 [Acinetobacter phage SH-Ab 15599]